MTEISAGAEFLRLNIWNRTDLLKARLEGRPELSYDEKQRLCFLGIPIIFRDTPINGGISLGGNTREAVTVDDSHDQVLASCLCEFTLNLFNAGLFGHELAIIEQIFYYVLEKMPSDNVQTIVKDCANDEIIPLGVFIEAHSGECRHKNLFAAYLAEQLSVNSLLDASVSFDRNHIPIYGAHGWARITLRGGVYILDPMRRFHGFLSQAELIENSWAYGRPEDY